TSSPWPSRRSQPRRARRRRRERAGVPARRGHPRGCAAACGPAAGRLAGLRIPADPRREEAREVSSCRLSHVRCEDAPQVFPAHRQMPVDRHPAKAERGGNRGGRHPFELVHHDDGPAARLELVECRPHETPGDDRGFHVRRDGEVLAQRRRRAMPNRGLAPLVATDVDEDAHQPGFLARHASRHRGQRPRRLEKGVLDQVARLVRAGGEPARETVEPLFVQVEEGPQACRWIVGGRLGRQRDGDGRCVHTAIDVRRPDSFGCVRTVVDLRREPRIPGCGTAVAYVRRVTRSRRKASTHELKRTLRRVFGHAALRPGQEDVIRAVMSGHDTLAVMPTGSGKSLCYQLPGLHLEGTTVVVSPLISLMKDQSDKLEGIGIEASQLNSALSKAETDASIQRLRDGGEFMFTTPERLASDPAFVEMLKRNTVDRFVIDEAHCVSQWGHDFRPAFAELKPVIAALGHPPVLALTATATPQVIDDIVASLGLRDPTIINTGIFRPNLRLEVLQTPSDAEKRLRLTELVRAREGTGIVYTATVKQVEAVEGELRAAGLVVEKYHGRLPARARRETQDRFIAGELDAIVATNAFGM